MSETESYFASLYGDTFDGWLWVGGFTPNKGGARHGRFVGTAAAAAEHALTVDREHGQEMSGVYHSSALYDPDRIRVRQKDSPGTRGTEADVRRMVAMFADLDVRIGVHKTQETLPETLADGMEIIRKVMPEPTLISFSGGGYYPIWKLETPVEIETPEMMREVKARYRGLSLEVIREMKAAGYHLDSTFDLARVYRVPGTVNRKGEPVMARIESNGGPYVPAAFLTSRAEAARGPGSEELDSIFVTTSQSWQRSVERSPWTQAQADKEIAKHLEIVRTADAGINTVWGGSARWIGRFVPEFLPEEHAVSELLAAAAKNEWHDDAWNAANNYLWTAESLIRESVARGMSDPHERRVETIETREAPPEPVRGDEVEALLAEMISWGQVAEQDPPKPLIKGLLSLDSESWMIGAPGSKKSFVALDMAAHVALGKPWMGRRVERGVVVMIVAEGAGGSGKRVKAWEAEHGEAPGANEFYVLPRPVQAKDRHAWNVLVEACRRLRPVMVTVDTQARVTVGLVENAAEDMGHYVEAVSAIRRATGACVLSVHHTGRTGGDARGSSAIDGAQYTELKVESKPGDLTGELISEKQKDIEEAPPIPLGFKSVQVGVDSDGDPVTSLVVVEVDEFQRASGLGDPQSSETVTTVIPDPQEWTFRYAPQSLVRRQLLQAISSVGGEMGLTQADAIRSVANRWYEGAVANSAREEGAPREVLKTAWSAFKKEGDGPDGEAVLVAGETSAKCRLHPMISAFEMS